MAKRRKYRRVRRNPDNTTLLIGLGAAAIAVWFLTKKKPAYSGRNLLNLPSLSNADLAKVYGAGAAGAAGAAIFSAFPGAGAAAGAIQRANVQMANAAADEAQKRAGGLEGVGCGECSPGGEYDSAY